MKDLARRIFYNALDAIDIRAAMERKLGREGNIVRVAGREVNLSAFERIVAIAFGKAAVSMAEGLSEVLTGYELDGVLVAPNPPIRVLPGWKVFIGGHPVPNAQSFAAGREVLNALAECDHRTLVFFLVSGGGSALVECPLDSAIQMEDVQTLHRLLVGCGASIGEINAVRKHLSSVKGGRLCAAAPDALKITLAISDVPAGEESAIASGPTLPDPTTLQDVLGVLHRFQLLERLPSAFGAILESGSVAETPKPGAPAFARSAFQLILTTADLLHATHRCCEAEGFHCLCDTSTDGWPVARAAEHLLGQLSTQKAKLGRPVAIIADGEVSSPVLGNGIGGRNAAFIIDCVKKIAGSDVCVLSAGTDGIDGNSPAAGAIADGKTLSAASSKSLDPAEFASRSDAYSFFAALDDVVVTGPTGNNLRDLRILLAR